MPGNKHQEQENLQRNIFISVSYEFRLLRLRLGSFAGLVQPRHHMVLQIPKSLLTSQSP